MGIMANKKRLVDGMINISLVHFIPFVSCLFRKEFVDRSTKVIHSLLSEENSLEICLRNRSTTCKGNQNLAKK